MKFTIKQPSGPGEPEPVVELELVPDEDGRAAELRANGRYILAIDRDGLNVDSATIRERLAMFAKEPA